MVTGGEHMPAGLLRRVERTIGTDYLQYVVSVDDGGFNSSWAGEPPNGLMDDNAEQLSITTGLQYGRVAVVLELWSQAPGLDLEHWDDVVEAGVTTAIGEIRLGELMSGPPRGMLNLAHAGPGTYRLRVSVRGRDLAGVSRSKELHRVQCWPAQPDQDQATVAHKLTDQVGRHMRGEPQPPPDLQPWELAGAHAMKEFVAAITAASLDEPTTTVQVSQTFTATRGRIFRKLTWLPVGNGGSGGAEVGYECQRNFFNKPDHSWSLKLWAFWQASAPPTRATWTTRWRQYSYLPSYREGPLLAGEGALELSLAWARPITTATFTHAGVPVSCAASLTGMWEYNLRRFKESLEGREYAWEPWTLLD